MLHTEEKLSETLELQQQIAPLAELSPSPQPLATDARELVPARSVDATICHLYQHNQVVLQKFHSEFEGEVDNTDLRLTMGDLVKKSVELENGVEELWFAEPAKSGKKRPRVYTFIHVNRLQIKEIEETFRAHFHVFFSWVISEADFLSYHACENREEWEPSFKPRIRFLSVAEEHSKEFEFYPDAGRFRVMKLKDFNFDKELEVDEEDWNPKHAYFVRAKLVCDIEFDEPFELESFPLDCQDLPISFRAVGRCILLPELRNSDFASMSTQSLVNGFQIRRFVIDFERKQRAGRKVKSSVVTLRIKAKRDWRPYFWNYLIVFAGISCFGITSFSLDGASAGDRLNILVTLVLTAVALSREVPSDSSGNVTLLDKYVLACYAFLTLLIVESSMFPNVFGEPVDRVLLYGSLAVYVVYHVGFIVYAYMLRTKEMEKLTMNSRVIQDFVEERNPYMNVDVRQRTYTSGEGRDALSFYPPDFEL